MLVVPAMGFREFVAEEAFVMLALRMMHLQAYGASLPFWGDLLLA